MKRNFVAKTDQTEIRTMQEGQKKTQEIKSKKEKGGWLCMGRGGWDGIPRRPPVYSKPKRIPRICTQDRKVAQKMTSTSTASFQDKTRTTEPKTRRSSYCLRAGFARRQLALSLSLSKNSHCSCTRTEENHPSVHLRKRQAKNTRAD